MVARNVVTGLTVGELLDFIDRHMNGPEEDRFLTRDTPIDCGSGYHAEGQATGLTMGMSSGAVRMIVAYNNGVDRSHMFGNVGSDPENE